MAAVRWLVAVAVVAVLLLAVVASVSAASLAPAARIGLRGEQPLQAYLRRSTQLAAIGVDEEEQRHVSVVRDAKAVSAAASALAALNVDDVEDTWVEAQGDGTMVAFARTFGGTAPARDAGLLYRDPVTALWSLLQYNSTLLAAPALELAQAVAAGAAADKRSATSTLAVCSFNIRYGTASDGANHWTLRRDMVFDLLNRYSYDIIGVQEALHFQLDEILASVPGYAYVGVGRDDGVEAGEYSAILYKTSRLRVAETGTFWFCDTPDVPGCTSYGNSIPRIATWGRFVDAATDLDFYVYNCHLDHQSAVSRELSVDQMVEHILSRPVQNTSVVVTGDFNVGESSSPIGGMRDAGFVDTFRVLYPNATNVGTFNSWVGTTTGDKIDYVFASDGVNGMESVETLEAAILHDNVDGRYPSDHFPVSATVVVV